MVIFNRLRVEIYVTLGDNVVRSFMYCFNVRMLKSRQTLLAADSAAIVIKVYVGRAGLVGSTPDSSTEVLGSILPGESACTCTLLVA